MIAHTLKEALDQLYGQGDPIKKTTAIQTLTTQLGLSAQGKLYLPEDQTYAVRFSYSSKGGFSNTVLGLAKLLKVDHIPVVVCLLMPTSYRLMLANTTFLSKISHTSQQLSETKIRGSFLGNDIVKQIDGIENAFPHFDDLFALHRQIPAEANMKRLVAATAGITATKTRLLVDEQARQRIYTSVRYSFSTELESSMAKLRAQLDQRVEQNRSAILQLAEREAANVNMRGNGIEQLITGSGNQHGLADEAAVLPDGGRLLVDIKTALANKSSSPKLYNIDKQLEALADGRTAFAIYFVYMDPSQGSIRTYMVNALDSTVLDHIRVQFHWAGRDSRGVTQLDAGIKQHMQEQWIPSPDTKRALRFIDDLIDERNPRA